MLLRDILGEKGNQVWNCSPSESLARAVSRLVEHNIGSLVVLDQGRMIGILTERDILRACHDDCESLKSRYAGDHMTANPVCGSPHDDIADAMGVMTEIRIRHLPIVDGDQLLGLVSIGDLVKAQHLELCQENHYLKTYIAGEA